MIRISIGRITYCVVSTSIVEITKVIEVSKLPFFIKNDAWPIIFINMIGAIFATSVHSIFRFILIKTLENEDYL